MSKLTNEFSWSASRGRLFHECRRAYWFSYYGAWEGWELRAPERTRLAYRLKKMTKLDMLAGEIVHRTIHNACSFASAVDAPATQKLVDDAVGMLRQAWQDSKNRRWEESPKRYTNLFEHYHGLPIPKEKTEQIKQKVLDCLRQFFASDIWQTIRTKPASSWLAAEELDSFAVAGIKVYAKPDLALKNGRVLLYDWKTGKPREADEDQLVGYALFALSKKWAARLSEIELTAFYLATGERKVMAVTTAQAKVLVARIKAEAAEMRELLADTATNTATEQDFAYTENPRVCRRCNFRTICEGAQRAGAGL